MSSRLSAGVDGGVAAPPLLAGAAGGPVPAGIGTTRSSRRHPGLRVAHPSVAGGAPASIDLGGVAATESPWGVPERLALAIVAANRIATLPYIWGGGHGSFDAAGYDCSGSVSYVLHAALALSAPEDSSALESYGDPGPGRWITVYANAAHAFMTLGGMRYDTSGLSSAGSRWQTIDQVPGGYVVRHPVGL
ncbi:MAG: hypothetical protein QOH12_543 [Solirubrobacteraceae bacterium]|nr:hypothetical protein [Solirubrobacteraceae bacterium]